jgi:hypothetical protein
VAAEMTVLASPVLSALGIMCIMINEINMLAASRCYYTRRNVASGIGG